ncbi:plasma-membrane proton-efflux P-type ATPase [bacterium]|nr:plasma-membrane proton-efflux P-type ATPase [bacterium]
MAGEATATNQSDTAGGRRGLTSAEARARLERFGPNAVAERKTNPLLAILAKFWAPVPWMLEATVALELAMGKPVEAIVIGALLVFNAMLSLTQEGRARGALEMLRQRLQINARVMRDGRWGQVPAEELVPGDFVYLRMGDIAPADIALADGTLLIDQSMLTGESLPVEAGPGQTAYAGALIKRGEGRGEVIATGAGAYFGKTAELVGAARAPSHLQTVIFSIVKALVAMDGALAAAVLAFAIIAGLPMRDALPFVLILMVASVPVALPATFTLATTLGAIELAGRGVLATRLAAIEEAAAMDVLCTDKTGTLTQNRLALVASNAYAPFSENELLRYAALTSDAATQDPIDLAILERAGAAADGARRTAFVPFDPATKTAAATIAENGKSIDAVKGAPQAVAARAAAPDGFNADVERLAAGGCRVLAVAAGAAGAMRVAGLLALQDPPRPDSRELVRKLNDLGVRVTMVTGDGLGTARAVAHEIGIEGRVCDAGEIRRDPSIALDCAVLAGVFPEDKFNLIRSLQSAGAVVGMTGDGVNDAPALRQAEVGIAVASATDVAKASASLVLTNPGLTDMLGAVETSRRIYQRMLTYTLNKIIKTVQIGLFLSLGVMLTRSFVVTPLLIVLLLFANDFVTMSIATDNVSFSRTPDRWRIAELMAAGLTMGAGVLALSLFLYFYGRDAMGMATPQLQTLDFIVLVFTGQGMVYLVRERGHFWKSRPSGWMLLASAADIVVICAMAVKGVLMAPLPAPTVGAALGICVLFLAALDFVKVPALRRMR